MKIHRSSTPASRMASAAGNAISRRRADLASQAISFGGNEVGAAGLVFLDMTPDRSAGVAAGEEKLRAIVAGTAPSQTGACGWALCKTRGRQAARLRWVIMTDMSDVSPERTRFQLGLAAIVILITLLATALLRHMPIFTWPPSAKFFYFPFASWTGRWPAQ